MKGNAHEPAVRYLRIIGTLRADDRLDLMPAYESTDARHSAEDPGSPLVATIMGADGAPLLTRRVHVAPMCAQEQASGALAVRGKLPLPKDARQVVFAHKGIPLLTLDLGKKAPKIQLTSYPKREGSGTFQLRWRATHPDRARLQYFVRYSHDGKNWSRVGPRTRDPRQTIDFRRLPGGSKCRIEVVATDGVNSTTKRGPAFRVERKPCIARILSPHDNTRMQEGEAIMLRGQGYWLEEGGPAAAEELVWASSLQGRLGTGAALLLSTLSVGRHRITLSTGTGKRAGKTQIRVTVAMRRRKGKVVRDRSKQS